MIAAWVFELVGGKEPPEPRGIFYFQTLPVVGDRVTLPTDRGGTIIAGVVQVEHAAVRAEADARERKEPLATLFVQWIEEERRSRRSAISNP
jgi:hypothetical protein